MVRPQAQGGGSVVSPVAQESRARLGALPVPKVKLKCTHHAEVEWSQGWLVCWLGAPGLGSRRKKKRGWET